MIHLFVYINAWMDSCWDQCREIPYMEHIYLYNYMYIIVYIYILYIYIYCIYAGNCCVEATHLVDVTVRILLNGLYPMFFAGLERAWMASMKINHFHSNLPIIFPWKSGGSTPCENVCWKVDRKWLESKHYHRANNQNIPGKKKNVTFIPILHHLCQVPTCSNELACDEGWTWSTKEMNVWMQTNMDLTGATVKSHCLDPVDLINWFDRTVVRRCGLPKLFRLLNRWIHLGLYKNPVSF